MYYFAYGSNMNFKQMQRRCPGSKFLTKAQLQGYKFVYDGYSSSRKGSVANIVKSENAVVWGAVFEIDKDCMKCLDRYEGFPTYYQRESVKVKDEQDNTYQAFVYLRTPQQIGKPSEEYKKILIEGARDCGLPEEYVKKFIKA